MGEPEHPHLGKSVGRVVELPLAYSNARPALHSRDLFPRAHSRRRKAPSVARG